MHPVPPVPPVLLTRPAADSKRLAEMLRGEGVEAIVAPLLRIVPQGPLPEIPGGVLLTSGNGVDSYVFLGGAGGRPAWVVGPRTARRAAAAGFDLCGVAPDAAALAEIVPQDAPPLVHLRGAVQRGDLAARLRVRGLFVAEAVIYRQEPVPLAEAARAALSAGPVVAPLYSPRTARLLGDALSPREAGNLRAICLSAAVADALRDSAGIAPVVTAGAPDGGAMLRAIRAHLKKREVESPGNTL
ncbi:uroporphyrinogen-III synthase [Jannaschia seosinensis]|uniref:Uroporphyrinogen-III synthase n=1 Tax=Jannaschia seosinensis TaxID=313367 RepID=A0A0M7B6I4_9RHOB|nr:uroporphyrinogen-III synthase [Jannaschia seosinensis]CUH09357.1 uroporphyrinogen-III synthase [Jannaschia seosinensis]